MPNIEATIHIPDDVMFRELDGEAVILHLGTGKYYGLDKVGTRMWSLLTEYGEVEPAIKAMLANYEVEEGRLQEDLLALINRLAEQGLIIVNKA